MEEVKYASSELFIKAILEKSNLNGAYVAPNIPEKKLINASKYIADGIDPMLVVGIFDDTLLGSAKDGIVFTGTAFYYKSIAQSQVCFKYEDISVAELNITEKKEFGWNH